MVDVRFERVTALPAFTAPDTIYFVKPSGNAAMTLWATGTNGVPVPLSVDLAFAAVRNTPTTLAGYGITDAQSANGLVAWGRITGTPTTLASYGITDAQSATGAVSWSRITERPTTLAGYGVTDAQPLDPDLTAIAAITTTAYGRGLLGLADAVAHTALLNVATTSAKGLLPQLSGDTATYLRGDGAYAVPPSSGGGGGSGTVTLFSFTNGNGFTGTVTNQSTTPTLSLTYNGDAGTLGGSAPSYYTNSSNQSSGTLPAARLPAFTGDVTTAAGSAATTLATVNSNVGTFGSVSSVPVITADGKGRLTSIGTAALGTAAAQNVGTAANNVPQLDSGGKLLTAVLPESIVGAMKFRGFWDASANVVTYRGTNQGAIPTAASANEGYYYIVTTAGSTNLNGITDWKVGDWAVSDGNAYGKIDSTDQVNSVAGLMGSITKQNLQTALDLSGVNTGDQTSVTGNAGTATKLQTPRNINNTPFDGTADITITANGPATHPGYRTGRVYYPDRSLVGTPNGASWGTTNLLYCTPIVIKAATTFSGVLVTQGSSGGGTYRVGLYASSAGLPSTLLAQNAADASVATGATSNIPFVSSVVLQPGTYFLAIKPTASSQSPYIYSTDDVTLVPLLGVTALGGVSAVRPTASVGSGDLPATFPTGGGLTYLNNGPYYGLVAA